jgi:hypothetical protein
VTTTAFAAPSFNSSNTLSLKKKKKKSAKLKGLTKKQKKKKWTFKSSDTSIAKVKRKGKYGYKITANKKKDGYTVIRATQSNTAIYLLVKVGKGGAPNATTRSWASTARSRYKKGTQAYNTWDSVVNYLKPNNHTNSNPTNHTTPTNPTTPTKPVKDPYAGYTTVPAEYSAENNKVKLIDPKYSVGKDKNGYNYRVYTSSGAVIGTDKTGKNIKAIPAQKVKTIEISTVNYMDPFYKTFNDGYYASWVGKNIYMTKQLIFVHIKMLDVNNKVVKIDSNADKALHGYKFSNDAYYQLGANEVVGVVALSSGDTFKGYLSDNSFIYQIYETTAKTTTVTVTADGVTKSLPITIKDRDTEYKNYYKHELSKYTNTQAKSTFDAWYATNDYTTEIPDTIKIAIGKDMLYYRSHTGIPNKDDNGRPGKGYYNVYQDTPWWITNTAAPYYQGTGTCETDAHFTEIVIQALDELYNLKAIGCTFSDPVYHDGSAHVDAGSIKYKDVGFAVGETLEDYYPVYKKSDIPIMLR